MGNLDKVRRPGRAEKTLTSFTLRESVPERMIELIPGLCSLGNETLYYGEKGIGKTTVTEALIAAVSTGAPLPGEPPYGPGEDPATNPKATPRHTPGQVIYLIAEDNRVNTVSPRLIAMGANLDNVHIVEGAHKGTESAGFDFANDVELVRAKIKEVELAASQREGMPKGTSVHVLLVVVSPISAYYGVKDSNDGSQVRQAIKPMTELLKEYNIAGWYLGHPRKTSADGEHGKVVDLHLGSVQLINAVRYAVYGCKCPDVEEDGTPTRARLFLRIISNITGDEPYGFKYTIDPLYYEGPVHTRVRAPDGKVTIEVEPKAKLKTTTITWLCRYDHRPDDVVKALNANDAKAKEDKSGAAVVTVLAELCRLNGVASAAHMTRVLKDAGITEFSRNKARKLMAGFVTVTSGGPNGGEWRLKMGGDEPPSPLEPVNTDHTDAEPPDAQGDGR